MMLTVIGNILFRVSTNWSVHAMLNHMGIVTAYNTTIGGRHSLGLDKKAMLKVLGCTVITGKIQLHLLYDNINQYHQAWRANLTTQNALESGMVGMVIIHQNVDPKVLDGMGFHQCKAECVAKEELT